MATPRRKSTLSDSLQKRINLYAIAASAASLSLIAANTAEAEVVHTQTDIRMTPGDTVSIDLNHDGVVDFNLHNYWSETLNMFENWLGGVKVEPTQSENEVWSYGKFASALPAGAPIGSHGNFQHVGTLLMDTGVYNPSYPPGVCHGPWKHVGSRYLGFKFVIEGEIHYGWALLSNTCGTNVMNTTILGGYAYQTIPNAPIVTPNVKCLICTPSPADEEPNRERESSDVPPSSNTADPRSLGSLALGASLSRH